MANITDTIKNKMKGLSPEKLEELKVLFPEEYKAVEDSRTVNVYLNKFVTQDADMVRVKSHVKILSELQDSVLITGPTGTGKELLARALHGDRDGKFVDINCAGMPETLIESELFGHVKGAFTGAVSEKVGLLQAAFGGTVFLDEIGELPLTVQAKLLRAIQERHIRRVGADLSTSEKPIPLNCRFIAATHRDIKASMIPAGQFREDLYWRLAVFTLETKPLRERTIDIEPIVRRIIEDDKATNKILVPINLGEFCDTLMRNKDKLSGNVRQLQTLVRNYHVFGKLPRFD